MEYELINVVDFVVEIDESEFILSVDKRELPISTEFGRNWDSRVTVTSATLESKTNGLKVFFVVAIYRYHEKEVDFDEITEGDVVEGSVSTLLPLTGDFLRKVEKLIKEKYAR